MENGVSGMKCHSFYKKKFIMRITAENKLKKLIIVGDRVLIKLKKPDEKTSSGLYLPPGVQEKERVQQGYIIKTGPGYPIPMPLEDQEPGKIRMRVSNISLFKQR